MGLHGPRRWLPKIGRSFHPFRSTTPITSQPLRHITWPAKLPAETAASAPQLKMRENHRRLVPCVQPHSPRRY